MKRALPLAAAVLLGTLASKAAENDLVSWTAFGIGTDSCVNWQSTDAHKTEGNAWILGFWSALNLASRIDAKIDADVDANSIWSEVAAACATAPSGKLADAVLVTYDKVIVKRPGVIGNWMGVHR